MWLGKIGIWLLYLLTSLSSFSLAATTSDDERELPHIYSPGSPSSRASTVSPVTFTGPPVFVTDSVPGADGQ